MKFQITDFDKIIFDMDGVITSEFIYWDAAALTIYELLYDYRFYGKQDIDRAWCRKNYELLFDTIFCGGRTVRAVKDLGVNTNWDLAYLVFCVSKYLEPAMTVFDSQHFESVCMFIENMTLRAPEIYAGVEGLAATVLPVEQGFFQRGGSGFWRQMEAVFQRWFLGDAEIESLQQMEQPLLDLVSIKRTLGRMQEQGIRLGIGTGRPRAEIMFPLRLWGLTEYFDPALIATYDEVQRAEEAQKCGDSLAKPHPFVFQKAAFGECLNDSEILSGAAYREDCKRVLVVGDATSDLRSAKAGGFYFTAVLSGIQGLAARASFEEEGADFIFESILEMEDTDADTDADTLHP